MSRPRWESDRSSERERAERGCCGPRTRRDSSEGGPGAGTEGLRWVTFALLLYLGVRGAQFLAPRLGELAWLPWVLFGVWWIPVAMDLSRRLFRGRRREWVLGRGLVRVRKISSGKALPPRRCPHCGEGVDNQEQAVCPHCYGDLKANCERCGRIFDLSPGSAAGSPLCEECRKGVRAQQPAA